jgi:hypothetical protein
MADNGSSINGRTNQAELRLQNLNPILSISYKCDLKVTGSTLSQEWFEDGESRSVTWIRRPLRKIDRRYSPALFQKFSLLLILRDILLKDIPVSLSTARQSPMAY